MTLRHRTRNEQLDDMSVNMTWLGIIEQLDVRRVSAFQQRGCHDAAIVYSTRPHGVALFEVRSALTSHDQSFIECAARSFNVSIDEDRVQVIREGCR